MDLRGRSIHRQWCVQSGNIPKEGAWPCKKKVEARAGGPIFDRASHLLNSEVSIVSSVPNEPWAEVYSGGSPEAERLEFHQFAQTMLKIQEKNRELASVSQPMRTLHSKILVGVTDARLQVDPGLPAPFHVDYFAPASSWKAAVRFSNASGVPKADYLPDMRGIAIKVQAPNGVHHDLLMTNYPISHARNARQFVEFAVIAMGDPVSLKQRLEAQFGADEAARMIKTVMQGMRPSQGLQNESFWSRGALLWGDRPVRLILRPMMIDPQSESGVSTTPDSLREVFARRVKENPVVYRLAIQRYVNEIETPIEDAAVEWYENVSQPIEVATLVIPAQDILSPQGMDAMKAVNDLAFNPWNGPQSFRPLGNINRARGEVYGVSAQRWVKDPRC